MNDRDAGRSAPTAEAAYPILTRLVAERYQHGRSATLDAWLAAARSHRDALKARSGLAKSIGRSEKVVRGIELAAEVVEQLLAASTPKTRRS